MESFEINEFGRMISIPQKYEGRKYNWGKQSTCVVSGVVHDEIPGLHIEKIDVSHVAPVDLSKYRPKDTYWKKRMYIDSNEYIKTLYGATSYQYLHCWHCNSAIDPEIEEQCAICGGYYCPNCGRCHMNCL